MVLGLALFAVSYALIAGPRLRLLPLDRPAGALLGAIAFIAFGVVSPAQAMVAVNLETLLLLFGLMGVGAVLAQQGMLQLAGDWALRRFRSPSSLLAALVWGSGASAALITNDAVCVLGTPLVVRWIHRRRLPPFPFLLALATAANTGSVATLVGNPQNMLCASLGGLNYRSYLLSMLPVALMGLAVNHGLIAWMFRRELRAPALPDGPPSTVLEPVLEPDPPTASSPGRSTFTAVVLAASVASYLLGLHLAMTAVAAFTVLLVAQRSQGHRVWAHIDWRVLVFFSALFVIVEGLVRSGGAAFLLALLPVDTEGVALWPTLRNATVFLIGSNVVSNVPFILVIRPQVQAMAQPHFWWTMLAMTSTFAGNMTLLGSVANIIVAEGGTSVGGLPFWRYLRVGLPLALITTLLGALWLFGLAQGSFG